MECLTHPLVWAGMVYSMFRFLKSQILQELSWLQVTEKKYIKIEKRKI